MCDSNFLITNVWYILTGYFVVPVIILFLLFFSIKNFKNKKTLFLIILLLFLTFEESIFVLSVLSNYADNPLKELKYTRLAAKIAFIPYEKGTIYSHIAYLNLKNKNLNEAIKNYEIAHKYLKNYNNEAYILAGMTYVWSNDYKKAIEIFEAQKNWGIISCIYVLEKNYSKAKKYALLQIEQQPDNPAGYSQAALVYKNLNDNKNAKIYYDKAVALCKFKAQFKQANEKYQNYSTYVQDYINKSKLEYFEKSEK